MKEHDEEQLKDPQLLNDHKKDVVNANIFKFGFRGGMDIVAQIMKNS